MEGIARRQGGGDHLQGEPALKESNCKLAVQQRMKRRTGTHSTVEIRGALSQGVVLLGCPQRPQQAKADGHFSKRKAEGIHDYLAGLKSRLVELFGEHAPQRCASHSSLVRSQMGHLRGDTPGNGLPVEASHHLSRCPEAVLFEFTEAVSIRATAENVWSRLSDLESWWLESNPEHISLEIGSPDKRVAVGTEIAFKERVAGIKASASGTVTSLIPGVAATWEGLVNYCYCGFDLAIQEGVTWRIEANLRSSTLSAHVWARFPAGAFGRFFEWYSVRILNVIERDRQHARCELEYLKHLIERAV